MLRTSSHVVFVVALGCGCASVPPARPANATILPVPEVVSETSAEPQAPPTVGGDIQFTMTDRKAKTPPAPEDSSSAALQPQKASTSGVTSTGVTLQHVHSPQ